MANLRSITLTAGGNINPRRFVKMDSTAFRVVQATANSANLGIVDTASRTFDSALAAASGEPVTILGEGEIVEVECGGNVTVGAFLKSDSNGKAVVVATTGTTIQQICAQALDAGADGEVIRVLIVRYSERPALS